MRKSAEPEVVALLALGWIASPGDLIGQFMTATGVGRDELAARAQEPEFLAAVLDFLLAEEAWLRAFCADEGLVPSEPARARARLPGGDLMHWT